MSIILLILLLILIIMTYLITKKNTHPFVIFGSLWFLIITLSLLRLYNMKAVSNNTYLIIFVGVFSFFFGTLASAIYKVALRRKRKIKKLANFNENESLKINWKVAYITLFIALFGCSVLFFTTIKYLLSGYSLMQIHNLFYGYGEDARMLSDIMNAIVSWISVPCLYVSLYVTIISFFEKNVKKSYFLLSVLAMVFYLFGNASRVMIVLVLISILITYKYYKPSIDFKIKKKTKKYILIGIVLFIILMIARKSNSTNKVNSLYAYLTIPVNILEYWVNYFKTNDLNYSYGSGFMFGIISWINWFISKVGINFPAYTLVSKYIIDTQNTWIKVFPGKSYNAFCSLFYYFYFDFGIVGIILESFIYGFVCYMIYYKTIIENEKKSLLLYLLMLQTILFSFVRWQFGTANFIVEILMSILIIYKTKSKKQLER